MASAGLNEENVEKRLISVTNTQDSIQSLSLWIIHHKTHQVRIIELWYKVMKKSDKPSHRLTLFYLCNDVVQNCKRKKALTFIENFKPLIRQATPLVRDNSIKSKVERIFNIWEERHVYDKDFVTQLKSILNGKRAEQAMFRKTYSPSERLREKAKERVKEKVKEKSHSAATEDFDVAPVADASLDSDKAENKVKAAEVPSEETLAAFKPPELIERMKLFKRQEAEMNIKVHQLAHLKLDVSSIEAIKQLKDRAHGNEFSTQFEESCVRLEEAVKSLEKKKVEQKELLAQLAISEYFYDQQYGEARIVVNAYKNYGSRLNNMKKRLDEMIRTLPSPIPSPTADAPSPGNTPPLMDPEDMDIEDPSEEAAGFLTTEDDDDVIPSPPDEAPSPVASSPGDTESPVTGSSRLENRLASFLPSLQTVGSSVLSLLGGRDDKDIPVYVPQPLNISTSSASHHPSTSKNLAGSEPALPAEQEGGSTPLTDEQPSTPVMDEEPGGTASPPLDLSAEKKKENPIDFLSRLISQTQKNKMAGAVGSNSSFLESFTKLADKVKEHVEQNKTEVEEDSATPRSWAAWKADNVVQDMEAPEQPPMPMPPIPSFALPPPPPPVPPPGVPLSTPLPVPPPVPPVSASSFYQHTSPGQKENWPQVKDGVQKAGDLVSSTNTVNPSVQEDMPAPPFPPLSMKPVFPVKGILRKSGSTVLKELTPSTEDPSPPEPQPVPPPPPMYDVQTMSRTGLGPASSISSLGSGAHSEAQEFMEKLKRKTSGVSTPPAYVASPAHPNLMTLTPGGEMDMDLDDDEEEEEEGEESGRPPVLSGIEHGVDCGRERDVPPVQGNDLDHNAHHSSSFNKMDTFHIDGRYSQDREGDSYSGASVDYNHGDHRAQNADYNLPLRPSGPFYPPFPASSHNSYRGRGFSSVPFVPPASRFPFSMPGNQRGPNHRGFHY